MSPMRAAVALMTAENDNMDAAQRDLLADLDRQILEPAALQLVGVAVTYLNNWAAEQVDVRSEDAYDEMRTWIARELEGSGLEAAADGVAA